MLEIAYLAILAVNGSRGVLRMDSRYVADEDASLESVLLGHTYVSAISAARP